ncbi:hypothetical protein ACFQEX_21775 [Roseibium salinum]|uniref:hypothetical protein n=1 Tax=Roseibium salinum TaxID=1604349 RepID=UPI00361BE56F
MIEAAMYVALGFCTAGLIGLAILPAFYRRAARLTEEALRAVNPSSYAEVRAAQDQARARHAVELRRVERQLDSEREKAAKFLLDASTMKAEIEQLKAHKDQVGELETKISEIEVDRQSIDLLSGEVKTLREKLSEAEKALAESWSEAPATKAAPASSGGKTYAEWLPAADTMTLTAITGLEAEVATLKARLAKYEPVVAGEVEAARDKAAKTRLAELEEELVDTESKYISAQVEVTRLSLLLDSANLTETELQQRLNAEIEKITHEKLRQESELKDKERALKRMSGQVDKLRNDLAGTPALAELRKELRALAASISGTETVSITAADASAGSARENGADHGRPASANGGAPHVNGSQAFPAANGDAGTTAARSSEIASAAQALVSRIVASNRRKPEPQTGEAAGTAGSTQSKPDDGSGASGKSKQKEDVA